jgi:DNA segregation ATPase FtsK/SpoIIIE-like protein
VKLLGLIREGPEQHYRKWLADKGYDYEELIEERRQQQEYRMSRSSPDPNSYNKNCFRNINRQPSFPIWLLEEHKPPKVGLRGLLQSMNDGKGLMIPLGLNENYEPVYVDLTSHPHTLVAGTSGWGKTVCLESCITSVVHVKSPEELKLVLVDLDDGVSFHKFHGIKHLMKPIVTTATELEKTLDYLTEEMARRKAVLKEKMLENIQDVKGYPYILFVIDELESVAKNESVMGKLTHLARLSRKISIHIIAATQTPKADVIPSVLRNNLLGKICFKVDNATISRVVLDEQGAETLNTPGQMVYKSPKGSQRIQGCFISPQEAKAVGNALRVPNGEIIQIGEKEIEVNKNRYDDMFYKFGLYCIHHGKATQYMFYSNTKDFICNKKKAKRIFDQLVENEVCDEAGKILMASDEFIEKFGWLKYEG